jgi:hypothetical protein
MGRGEEVNFQIALTWAERSSDHEIVAGDALHLWRDERLLSAELAGCEPGAGITQLQEDSSGAALTKEIQALGKDLFLQLSAKVLRRFEALSRFPKALSPFATWSFPRSIRCSHRASLKDLFNILLDEGLNLVPT